MDLTLYISYISIITIVIELKLNHTYIVPAPGSINRQLIPILSLNTYRRNYESCPNRKPVSANRKLSSMKGRYLHTLLPQKR